MRLIYLDNAATTRMNDSVFDEMSVYLRENYANPAVAYSFARKSSDAVEAARAQVARVIGAQPREMRDHLIERLLAEIPGCTLNGHPERRLPGNANVTIAGIDASEVRSPLDAKGICVSTGSACNATSPKPSYVLLAIGLTRAQTKGALRITFSEETTLDEIDYAADAIAQAVRSLREVGL